MGVKLTVPCGNNAGVWQGHGGGCQNTLVWPEHSFIVYKKVLLAGQPLASLSSSFQTLKINKNMEWEGTEALQL